jgi:hypothetical protein
MKKQTKHLVLAQETLRNLTQDESHTMDPDAGLYTTMPWCPTGVPPGGPPPLM